jgi:phosphatidylserine/phosphatidylglycerophosphate/cardiolipin synthase-like enzyme
MKRAMLAALVLASVTLVVIPAAHSGPPQPPPRPTTSAPYIHQLADYLRTRDPETEGKIWWITSHNELPQTWLLQTPDCWGNSANRGQPCLKPGETQVLKTITRMVAEARTTVDITDLWPPPDERFLGAVIDGLEADYKNNHRMPLLRIIAGPFVGEATYQPDFDTSYKTAAGYLKELQDVAGRDSFSVRAEVAYVKSSIVSWVHEKAIDIDGHDALIGGMNYWTLSYLTDDNPVADVSMEVVGPAAASVLSFDNILWGWACDTKNGADLAGNVTSCPASATPDSNWSPPSSIPPPVTSDATILTVGHLGVGITLAGLAGQESPPINTTAPDGQRYPDGNYCPNIFGSYPVSLQNNSLRYELLNPGEDALRGLIGLAKTSIVISQQDLLSCAPWKYNAIEPKYDWRFFRTLAIKVIAKVPITIVVSGGTASADYNNGWSLADIADVLETMVNVQGGFHSTAKARDAVCADVSLATVKLNEPAPWRNHAKLVDVDNKVFYIGSENIYPARLQELGMVVEDPVAAEQLKSQYLDPLWNGGPTGGGSKDNAVIDPSKGFCKF